MPTYGTRTSWSDDRLHVIGLAIAGFGPLAVAAGLVPVRDDLASSNAVLVFAIVVVLAAACGGRAPGLIAAVVATASYDFFLTRPYLSLTIDRGTNIVTAALLLAIGLIVAELASFGYRSRRASELTQAEITQLHRVAELVADGTETDDVLLSVEAELLELRSLHECEFEQPPFGAVLPRIERNGTIEGGRRRFVSGEFTLPAEGVEIEVIGRGHLFGRLVLIPDWDVGVSLEERVVAVALVDQIGAALAADRGSRPATGRSLR